MPKGTGQKTSSHVCHHPFEGLRRKNAEERQAERAKRTPEQQLAELDAKLGTGKGAEKERARLVKLVEETKAAGKKK